MTTNQTIDGVPRELRALLERVVGKTSQTPHWDALDEDRIAAAAELRALLDAERCTSCDGSGDLIDLTGEWRGYCVCPAGVALKNKPADQVQGEPVAWLYTRPEQPEGVQKVPDVLLRERANPADVGGWKEQALYAGQPAPVAVVLAEAREWLGDGKHSDGLTREHWTPEYAALIDRIDATLRK